MTALASIDIHLTPAALPCPVCGLSLVTDGMACPACDGAGTLPTDGPWEDYCDTCRGSGLRYWCPACGRGDEETNG